MTKYFVLKYHDFSGIVLGNVFTLHGFLIDLVLRPIKDPINTKGAEQHIHNKSKANIVPKLT